MGLGSAVSVNKHILVVGNLGPMRMIWFFCTTNNSPVQNSTWYPLSSSIAMDINFW